MTRLSCCSAAGRRWTLRGVCLTFTWHAQGRGTQTDRMSGLFVCWSRLAHGLWGYRRSVSTDPAASQAHKSRWVDGCIQRLTEDSVYVSLATHFYERRSSSLGPFFCCFHITNTSNGKMGNVKGWQTGSTMTEKLCIDVWHPDMSSWLAQEVVRLDPWG